MEPLNNLKHLFAAIRLTVAGVISPPHNLDARSYKTSTESLTIAFIAITASATVYLFWNLLTRTKGTY